MVVMEDIFDQHRKTNKVFIFRGYIYILAEERSGGIASLCRHGEQDKYWVLKGPVSGSVLGTLKRRLVAKCLGTKCMPQKMNCD